METNLESQPIDENKSEETLTGWYQKDKKMEKMYHTIDEEERFQSTRTSVQCIDFLEVTTAKVQSVSQRVPSDLRGGTVRQHLRVLVAALCSRKPTLKLTNPPCCHVPGPSSCIHANTSVVNDSGPGGTGTSCRDPTAAWYLF